MSAARKADGPSTLAVLAVVVAAILAVVAALVGVHMAYEELVLRPADAAARERCSAAGGRPWPPAGLRLMESCNFAPGDRDSELRYLAGGAP